MEPQGSTRPSTTDDTSTGDQSSSIISPANTVNDAAQDSSAEQIPVRSADTDIKSQDTSANAMVDVVAPPPASPVATEPAASPSVTTAAAPASSATPEPVQPTVPTGSPNTAEVAQPEGASPAEVAPVVTTGGKGRKKWLVPVLVGGLLALLAGGYVLGFYLPNRPENAYKIGMKLTGMATDRVVDYMKERKAYPATKLDATVAVKQAGGSVDFTIKGESSDKLVNMTVDANITGRKVNADIRVADAAQSENPDIYLKLTGVTPLVQQMANGQKLAQLDGKWIAIDHTIFDSYQKQLESGSGANLQKMPTQEQIVDAMTKVQQVNKDYLFTTDKNKAVLVYKEYVGKATRNSRAAFHYKTTYDKAHLKTYVKELGKALDSSKLNDWSKAQAGGKKISALLQLNSLEDSIDKAKNDQPIDLYVDKGTKLIQSVVFTDNGNNPGTLTIAQNYTGGDKYPFEISAQGTGSNKLTMNLGMTLDTKSDKTLFSAKMDPGSGGTSFTMNGAATPSAEKVTVDVPTGAVPIVQVMQQLGIDPSMFTQSTPSPVQNTPSSTNTLAPSRT